ncbi:hypothetical protein DSO57_1030042 [Entomophthora muscae]|uniref:Uncharacterized protein n=1 Tax=Entomophthora muscae TaxID=34485 RepID=A0ACC2TBW3_9FUNG|nr:hypothetical protein DSO57_1030042 [Entomophthora muscae]
MSLIMQEPLIPVEKVTSDLLYTTSEVELKNDEVVEDSDTAWGREKHVGIGNAIISTLVFLFSPLLVFYFWHALEHYQGSLLAPITAILESDRSLESWSLWTRKLFPTPTWEGFQLYGGGLYSMPSLTFISLQKLVMARKLPLDMFCLIGSMDLVFG